MRKTVIVVALLMTIFSANVSAADAKEFTYGTIGVDRFAHVGCSYVIADQLHRAGMNKFWAGFTTLAIGAAKEQWLDDHFDKGDFAADCAGVLAWRIKF